MLYIRMPSEPSECYGDTGCIYGTQATYIEFKDLCIELEVSGQVKIDCKDEQGQPTHVAFLKYNKLPEQTRQDIEVRLELRKMHGFVLNPENKDKPTRRHLKYRKHVEIGQGLGHSRPPAIC